MSLVSILNKRSEAPHLKRLVLPCVRIVFTILISAGLCACRTTPDIDAEHSDEGATSKSKQPEASHFGTFREVNQGLAAPADFVPLNEIVGLGRILGLYQWDRPESAKNFMCVVVEPPTNSDSPVREVRFYQTEGIGLFLLRYIYESDLEFMDFSGFPIGGLMVNYLTSTSAYSVAFQESGGKVQWVWDTKHSGLELVDLDGDGISEILAMDEYVWDWTEGPGGPAELPRRVPGEAYIYKWIDGRVVNVGHCPWEKRLTVRLENLKKR